MATNEIKNGCGSSIEAVLASNQKRRRVYRLRVAGPSTSTPPSCVVRTIDSGTDIIAADPSQTRGI